MNYFTTKQIANILGYNDDSYIRKLVLSGKLGAQKIGKQWMISEEDVHKYRIGNEIKSKYKALLFFNQELRALVDKVIDKEQKILGPRDMFASFAIGKGYKTHAAIILLCKNGYGEDAAILTRSLFDLLINLLYILADKEDKRAYRYFRHDWILRKKMLNYAMEKPDIMEKIQKRVDNPNPNDVTLREVEEQAKIVQDMYGYKDSKGWSDKSLFDMADEVDRVRTYKTVYRLQCQLDHNASRSMNEYAKEEQGGVVFDIGQSENWVEESLVIAFDLYSSILKAFNSHFKLDCAADISSLEDRYVTELDTINNNS